MHSDAPTLPDRGGELTQKAHPLQRGAQVGRYVVLDKLGEGGMGVVYAAYDPDLSRKVALKLLQPEQRSSEARERLIREAQAMARVDHPNVVRVFDVGTMGDAIFVAMELVDGVNFCQWLTQRKRPWREVLRVFVAAGRGLQAAHEAGVVHRDVKPDNFLMGRDGRVRVMDFGIARDVDALEPSARTPAVPSLQVGMTQAGSVMGTPQYMAPEQWKGQSSDARTDEFSFAIALGEAISEGTVSSNSESTPGHPGLVGLKPTFAANVPGWVRRPLLRASSPRIEDRYPSMAELLRDLDRDPAVAWRRWLTRAAVVCLAGGAVAGGVVVSRRRATACASAASQVDRLWGPKQRAAVRAAFEATHAPFADAVLSRALGTLDRYASKLVKSRVDACEATQVRHEESDAVLELRNTCLARREGALTTLATLWTDHPAIQVVAQAPVAAQGLPAIEPCADVSALKGVVLPPDDIARCSELQDIRQRLAEGETLLVANLLDRAEAKVRPAVDLANATGYGPVTAEAEELMARILLRSGHPVEAEPRFRTALWAAQAGRDDALAARAALGVLHSAITSGRIGDYTELLAQAKAFLARAGENPELDLELEELAARASEGGSKPLEAIDAWRDAAEHRTELHGNQDPELARMLYHLSDLEKQKGDADAAKKDWDRAEDAAKLSMGDQNPEIAHMRPR